ncbi:MAG: helix-turn-helix transcriptional regulator [Rubrobacter sp.]
MDQIGDGGIGREVRRLRELRGWSQSKLAVEAEMSVSGVSMIENGHRNLTTTTLEKLARSLGVEVRDLFPLGQPQLPESLAADDVLEQAGVETRWGVISDKEWDGILERADAAEAMRLYEEVEAERIATLDLRHRIGREGTRGERVLVARMWEKYLVRGLRAAHAAKNELVLEEAIEGAPRELVGGAAGG